MTWDTLTVFAAEAPLSKTGAAIGQPIVRDTQGRIFVVRDVLNEDPYPNMLIDEQDLISGKIGSFVIVPECEAKRGFLTIVISAEFHGVLKQTQSQNDLGWQRLDTPGFQFAYIEMGTLKRWRDKCAKFFLEWSKQSLSSLLKHPDHHKAEEIEKVLRQVHFITDEGTEQFREMYWLLGVLLSEYAPSRWNVIKSLAVYELDSGDDSLDKAVDDYRGSLREKLDLPPEIFGREALSAARKPAGQLEYA